MTRSLRELMSLSGRVALVTGGAGHLGRVICETLAELGAAVAVLDREGSRAVADDLASRYGVPALGIDLDLADQSAVITVPERVSDALGGFDVLVNNAAFVGSSALSGWVVPFADQTFDAWRQALEVNLTAVFGLSQASIPFLTRGTGAIINVASIYGVLGPDWSLYEGTAMGNPAAYAASKGGLIQLSRWLSTTVAPSVRVNAISPGGVARSGQPEVFRQRYEARTPLRRMACEEDFKGVVAFLASDASAYVTGQNIVVDGGWSAW